MLVEGSEPYRYLYFLDKLKKGGLEGLSESDKTYLDQIDFKNCSQKGKCLYLRNLLLSYDVCEDPEKRKHIIDKLLEATSIFRTFDFNYKKAERAGITQDKDTGPSDEEIRKNATLDESLWKPKAGEVIINDALLKMRLEEDFIKENAEKN